VRVLVAGELNPDLILRNYSQYPEPGKEVLVEDAELTMGSSTAICAMGLARLGDSVTFASAVGHDAYGSYCCDTLQRARIDISHVARRTDLKTGITVSITSSKDRALVTYLGAIAALRAEDLPDEIFAGQEHFHVSSYYLQEALRPGLKDRFAAAHGAGVTTSLDTGYDPSETWGPDLLETLAEVDVFLPNEVEIQRITGCHDVEEGLRKLDNGRTLIVAKLGARGCAVIRDSQWMRVPAFRVDVVDSTGAGDSFNAGFLHSWRRGDPLEASMQFAAACGALSMRGLGGVATQPTEAEAASFLLESRVTVAN
jgi:sugar/nucleoside kinase (ribokinase family)